MADVPIDGGNRKIAILIAILAALLAISEIAGKGAQTGALTSHIEASNLWAFFQAKTIRGTTVRTAVETAEAMQLPTLPADAAERARGQVERWKATIARYDSEPDTQEGRKELMARAKAAEARRDRAAQADDWYDLSSGAYQLAIVLASAAIITGVTLLVWVAGGLGLFGIACALIAWLAPTFMA